MARACRLCLLSVLAWSGAVDACLKDCSLTSKNFTYSCENIYTVRGYTYRIPDSVPSQCLKTCEQGWYYNNNTFLVDSKEPGELSEPVVNVTIWNLTTHTCLDEPYWKMDCHCSADLVIFYIVESSKAEDLENEAMTYNANVNLLWMQSIPVFIMLK